MATFIAVLAFALPLWVINMSANFLVPARRLLPRFMRYDRPLDGGKAFFDGRRILGDSVTVYGLILSFALAFPLAYLLPETLGSLLLKAACVYFGGAAGSFIKRRLGYRRGEFIPVIDHGNYVIASGLVFWLNGFIPGNVFFFSLVLTYIFHPLVCLIGYWLHIKSEPY